MPGAVQTAQCSKYAVQRSCHHPEPVAPWQCAECIAAGSRSAGGCFSRNPRSGGAPAKGSAGRKRVVRRRRNCRQTHITLHACMPHQLGLPTIAPLGCQKTRPPPHDSLMLKGKAGGQRREVRQAQYVRGPSQAAARAQSTSMAYVHSTFGEVPKPRSRQHPWEASTHT